VADLTGSLAYLGDTYRWNQSWNRFWRFHQSIPILIPIPKELIPVSMP